jgi:hypothetical protein
VDAEALGRSLDVIHPRRRPLRAEAREFLDVMRQTAMEIPALVAGGSKARRASPH